MALGYLVKFLQKEFQNLKKRTIFIEKALRLLPHGFRRIHILYHIRWLRTSTENRLCVTVAGIFLEYSRANVHEASGPTEAASDGRRTMRQVSHGGIRWRRSILGSLKSFYRVVAGFGFMCGEDFGITCWYRAGTGRDTSTGTYCDGVLAEDLHALR